MYTSPRRYTPSSRTANHSFARMRGSPRTNSPGPSRSGSFTRLRAMASRRSPMRRNPRAQPRPGVPRPASPAVTRVRDGRRRKAHLIQDRRQVWAVVDRCGPGPWHPGRLRPEGGAGRGRGARPTACRRSGGPPRGGGGVHPPRFRQRPRRRAAAEGPTHSSRSTVWFVRSTTRQARCSSYRSAPLDRPAAARRRRQEGPSRRC